MDEKTFPNENFLDARTLGTFQIFNGHSVSTGNPSKKDYGLFASTPWSKKLFGKKNEQKKN